MPMRTMLASKALERCYRADMALASHGATPAVAKLHAQARIALEFAGLLVAAGVYAERAHAIREML